MMYLIQKLKSNSQKWSVLLLPFAFCLLTLCSCVKDKPQEPQMTSVNINSTNKVFIVNEGGYMHSNASISLFDATTNNCIEDFYKQQNPTSTLGDVCQSITKYNNNYYLVINNSHKIEIVATTDFKNNGTITGFNSPRYILPITYNKAYVSDLYSNSIQIVNLNTNAITGSIPTYSNIEEMALIYNKAIMTSPSSNYCYVLNTVTNQITDSINVGMGASSIVIDKNSNVWILSSGNSSTSQNGQLTRINPVSLQIEVSLNFNLIENPNHLCINKTRDTLYYLNKGVYQFPIINTTLPLNPIINQGSKTYYGLGINPIDYHIYVSDAIDYQQKSTIEIYNTNGFFKTSFKAGYISNGFVFE